MATTRLAPLGRNLHLHRRNPGRPDLRRQAQQLLKALPFEGVLPPLLPPLALAVDEPSPPHSRPTCRPAQRTLANGTMTAIPELVQLTCSTTAPLVAVEAETKTEDVRMSGMHGITHAITVAVKQAAGRAPLAAAARPECVAGVRTIPPLPMGAIATRTTTMATRRAMAPVDLPNAARQQTNRTMRLPRNPQLADGGVVQVALPAVITTESENLPLLIATVTIVRIATANARRRKSANVKHAVKRDQSEEPAGIWTIPPSPPAHLQVWAQEVVGSVQRRKIATVMKTGLQSTVARQAGKAADRARNVSVHSAHADTRLRIHHIGSIFLLGCV